MPPLTIINSGDLSRVFFSVPAKSVDAVIHVFSGIGNPKTLAEAVNFILEVIRSLASDDFVDRQCLFDDVNCIADVYGVIVDGLSWYVKFYIVFRRGIVSPART